MLDLIAWPLSWLPGWSVTTIAWTLGIGGLVAVLYGRFRVLPYASAAALLGPLAVVVAAYLVGVGAAQSVQEAKALREENAVLKDRLATEQKLRADDAERAKADAEQNRRNEELADDTPPNDSVCLPRDAARRVRAIQ